MKCKTGNHHDDHRKMGKSRPHNVVFHSPHNCHGLKACNHIKHTQTHTHTHTHTYTNARLTNGAMENHGRSNKTCIYRLLLIADYSTLLHQIGENVTLHTHIIYLVFLFFSGFIFMLRMLSLLENRQYHNPRVRSQSNHERGPKRRSLLCIG